MNRNQYLIKSGWLLMVVCASGCLGGGHPERQASGSRPESGAPSPTPSARPTTTSTTTSSTTTTTSAPRSTTTTSAPRTTTTTTSVPRTTTTTTSAPQTTTTTTLPPGPASSLYVDPAGSNSSTCGSASSPCATLTYVLANRSSAGSTIILSSGTYADSNLDLTSVAKHQNVTITASPSVISGLGSFTRGIPSGNDARPYFPNAHFNVAVPGVTLSYLRVRGGPAPYDGAYDGIIGINSTLAVVDHCELWNGNQGIQVNVKKQVKLTQNHIHTLGSMTSTEDTHGVSIVGSGAAATGWDEAITISESSIHDAGGDAVQESTNCYSTGTFNYLIIANNNLYDNQEQAFDSKGTRDLRLYGNDIHGNGYGGISSTTPEDCRNVVSMDRWDIYDNTFHDQDEAALYWANSIVNASAWRVYNNLFYRNSLRPAYNVVTIAMPGDSGSYFVGNTVVDNTATNGNRSGGIADCGMGANIRNNIFYNNGGSSGYGNITTSYYGCTNKGVPSNNYVYPSTIGQTGTNAKSSCYATGNCPGFVNAATHDFHLLAASPAVDSGATLASPFLTDYEGNLRGSVGAWDLGAFELTQ